ncbi:FecR family protein [Tsuneonella rigui]|uniref:FecR family protein n=1 Tax=Tsuneonella rigui TaxID=1708790 RepID=UPI000F7D97CC|nr:FecR domain-containing protein [Tsuneonella rigui]
MTGDDRMHDDAIAWAVRTNDPAFEDWEGFTAWLEADPAHARAYDAVNAGVSELVEADLPPPAQNDFEPASAPVRRPSRWLAVAASVALVAGFSYVGWRGQSQVITTEAGEVRNIALSDGTQVTLSGGSELRLARNDDRSATLERGQALFTVRHDSANPFVVHAAGQQFVDAGTVFDVALAGEAVTVAVSEGLVVANPKGRAQRIEPGQQLRVAKRSAYRLSSIATDRVGEWREGRLTFDDAPLSFVASELTRSTGIAFKAAPAVASRPISGSILVSPIRSDPAAVADLLGVTVRRDGQQWIIDRP